MVELREKRLEFVKARFEQGQVSMQELGALQEQVAMARAELAKHRGLLLGTSGILGNTLRLTPPMCITKDDADFIVDCLDEVLAEVARKTPG